MKTFRLTITRLLISGICYSQTTVKKITGLIILVLFSTTINSQPVDNGMIKSISQNWANSHNLNPEITNIICKTRNDAPLLYIVNFEKGWVMISADESLKPILGFSFDTNYSEDNEADAIKSLFEFYSSVKNENIINNIKYTTERDLLLSGNLKSAKNIEEVEPLLPVNWAQYWPYNAYCPIDNDPDLPDYLNGHHNTSCGPTAFAQVLRHWRYPVHGTGYHNYSYTDYGLVEANFETEYYNWENMPVSLEYDDSESTYKDIATLMFHVGVSVDNSYSSGGGLNQYSSAAVQYFGYSPTCEVLYRDDFTNTEWHSIFKNDLDNERPIMMSGCSEGSAEPWENGVHYGHYFVCDGYYGEDFYHINWGWQGSGNGYFPLFSLGDYIYQNNALIGLEPNYKKKELVLNDSYTVDDSTIVLLHFDGDLINQSSLSSNPNEHGTISFTDNSELGLGKCLYINNTNQDNQSFLDIADNNSLDLSGDWTIEMWFKPKSFGDEWYEKFTLINKPGDNENFDSNYSVYFLPTSDWNAKSLLCSYFPSVQIDNNPARISTDRNFLELDKWYHFSYIRNTTDKTLKLIIHNSNKELIHYQSRHYCDEVSSQPLLNANPLLIGSSNEANTYFDGYIDELRISNVVRKFEITSNELTILAPNGGENMQPGSVQQISWSCVNIDNLKIEYTADNGQSWTEIIATIPASTGSYNWTLPEIDSDKCKIKLTDVSDVNVYVKNKSAFSIQPYDLTINTPAGGNYYIPGTSTTITWESTPVSNIKIEYTSDNGGNWTEIAANINASLGSYDWIIPNTVSSQCKIKITDITNAAVFDESDNTFDIGSVNNAGGPYAVDDNTVVLLHFEGDLINQSPLSDDGISQGTGNSYGQDTPLNQGMSLNVDGSSYIAVPHNDNLNLSENWTIEAWIKLTEYRGYPNDPYILRKPGDTDNYWANYAIGVVEAWGNVFHGFYYPGDNVRTNVTNITTALNKWYHVAFIRDITNSSISITVRDENWEIVSSTSNTFTDDNVLLSSQDIRIGENFNGYIDELRVSNIVRNFENTGTGISENTLGDLISMYPNPASNTIIISSPKVIDLSILNVAGQKVIEKRNFLNENIDVSTLKKGIYIVTFVSKKEIASKKLIVK